MKRVMSIIFMMIALRGGSFGAALGTITIADKINASGHAVVTHPAALNARLIAVVAEENTTEHKDAVPTGGYRIQVFSGNNARTAQADAESRAAMIRDQFPDVATYVIYDAPYWRLRVGDFTTYEEAAATLSNLKRAYPSFAREMRLVRDRINAR